jgi:hypothetical protein
MNPTAIYKYNSILAVALTSMAIITAVNDYPIRHRKKMPTQIQKTSAEIQEAQVVKPKM